MTYPNPVYRVDGDTIPAQDHNSTAERAVWRFATDTERDAVNPTPQAGDVCYVSETNRVYVWGGQPAAWQVVPYDSDIPVVDSWEYSGYRRFGGIDSFLIPAGQTVNLFNDGDPQGRPTLTVPAGWGTNTEAVLWGGVTVRSDVPGQGRIELFGNINGGQNPQHAEQNIVEQAVRFASVSQVWVRAFLTGEIYFDLSATAQQKDLLATDVWMRYIVRRTA